MAARAVSHNREPNPEKSSLENIGVEQNLLGALLINNDILARVSGIINAGDFADPVHGRIYAAILDRVACDAIASPATLSLLFERDAGVAELGGPAYLARLAGAAISLFAARDYAEIIRALAEKRRLAAALEDAQEALLDPERDAGAILAQVEAFGLSREMRQGAEIVPFSKAVGDAIKADADAMTGDGPSGVQTGIDGLDRMLGGLHPGQLVILGGRPAMGKTALAGCVATHAATSGHGVAFVSLEMDPASIARRAISEATALQGRGVAYDAARKGILTDDEFEDYKQAAVDIHELPIRFAPPAARDIEGIFVACKRISKVFEAQGTPLGLVIVDYLQLVQADRKSRYEIVTEVSIALKSMAMRLGVPVLVLAQLSRGVDSRDDHRPIASDLRESGQIEQDADVILFCYREEVYLRREWSDDMESDEIAEWHKAMTQVKGIMEIIVEKQRNGDTGTVRVRFDPPTNNVRGIG